MKTYNAYKESGIEWMGNIPTNWKLIKNRYGFLKYKNSKNESHDTTVLSLTIRGLKIKTNLNFGKSTESYIGHQLVEEGDIVFTPRDFDQTPILSDVSNYSGCISNLYIVDKTKKGVLNHFVNYYWHGLKYSVDYFKNFSHGIRYSFNRFQFDEIPLLIPPLSEQQQIVSFLDTKTSLIDSQIDNIQQKIKLLKEKRTSLINEAVTKGMNPNMKMKDSGVKWIGKIPSGWLIGKLYQYSQMNSGSTPSREKPEYWENGTIPWMSSGEINKKKIKKIDGRITQLGFSNSSTKLLPAGTVMIGLNGQGKTKGTVGILEIETTCNQSLCGMIFNHSFAPMYAYYFLDSQYKIIRGLVGEGQREGISVSFLGRFPICVPPISEQNKIVSYLNKQTQFIDKMISIEEKRIKLLKEYGQSLISSTVMGKIRISREMT